MYCDSHLHLIDLAGKDPAGWNLLPEPEWRGAVVSHDPEEYSQTQELRLQLPPTLNGFGIHPQAPRTDTMEFLSGLAARNEIDLIGESGFDFFGDIPSRIRNGDTIREQRVLFEFQIALSEKHGLPLLVHTRKSMDLILGYGRQLRRLPAVIFHSWPGRSQDAKALLRQGINAYFSFGTTLLRAAPNAMETCKSMEKKRILSETDAPWQPPRGEAWTKAGMIVSIVGAIARLNEIPTEEARLFLSENFFTAFGRRI